MTLKRKQQQGTIQPPCCLFVYRKRILYYCLCLFLLLWCLFYLRLSAADLHLVGTVSRVSLDSKQQAPSSRTGPSVQVIRASQLRATNRTKRMLVNQEKFLSFHQCPVIPNDSTPQTTLVTQLSVERFWLVQETCQNRWKNDPMSVAIYFSSTEEYEQYADTFTRQLVRAKCRHVHLIYYIDDTTSSVGADMVYPINLLRNLALETVQTSHVLVHDVDFVPAVHLTEDIRAAWAVRDIARRATGTERKNEALVVPALQTNLPPEMVSTLPNDDDDGNNNNRRLIPSTFDEALLCLRTGLCRAFDENQNQAHGATRTDVWLQRQWHHTLPCSSTGKPMKDLRYVTCIDTPAYEPYLVVPWCPTAATTNDEGSIPAKRIVPYYDERFVGYGWNKIQYIHHLRYMGFLLWVVPAGFLVHVPHAPSASLEAFTFNRLPARQAYQAFETELQERFEWKLSNLRTCQHWNKHFANMSYDDAFCKAYV